MELVAKIHGKMKPNENPFQNKYKDGAVGFEKLSALEKLGFKTHQHHLPFREAWEACENENKAKRYPLVSLPTESLRSFLTGAEGLSGNRHIFITSLNPKLILVYHYFGSIGPCLAEPDSIQGQVLRFDASYKVNLVTYTLQ